MAYELDEWGLPVSSQQPAATPNYTLDEFGLPVSAPEQPPPGEDVPDYLIRKTYTDAINDGSKQGADSRDRASAEYAAKALAKFDADTGKAGAPLIGEQMAPADLIEQTPHEKLMAADRYRQVYGSAVPVLGEDKAQAYAKERIGAEAKSEPFLRDDIFADMMAMPKGAAFAAHYLDSHKPVDSAIKPDASLGDPFVEGAQPQAAADTGMFQEGATPTPTTGKEAERTFAIIGYNLSKGAHEFGEIPALAAAGVLSAFGGDGTAAQDWLFKHGVDPHEDIIELAKKNKPIPVGFGEQAVDKVSSMIPGLVMAAATKNPEFLETAAPELFSMPAWQAAWRMASEKILQQLPAGEVMSTPGAVETGKAVAERGGGMGEVALEAGLQFEKGSLQMAMPMAGGGSWYAKALTGGGIFTAQDIAESVAAGQPITAAGIAASAFVGAVMGQMHQEQQKILVPKFASVMAAMQHDPENLQRVSWVADQMVSADRPALWVTAELHNISTHGVTRDEAAFQEWKLSRIDFDKAKAEADQNQPTAAEQVVQPTAAETATPEARETLAAAQDLVGDKVASRQAAEQQSADMRARIKAEQDALAQPPPPEGKVGDFQARLLAAQQRGAPAVEEEAPPTPPAPKRAGRVSMVQAAEAAKRADIEQAHAEREAGLERERQRDLAKPNIEGQDIDVQKAIEDADARARGEGEPPETTTLGEALRTAKVVPPKPKPEKPPLQEGTVTGGERPSWMESRGEQTPTPEGERTIEGARPAAEEPPTSPGFKLSEEAMTKGDVVEAVDERKGEPEQPDELQAWHGSPHDFPRFDTAHIGTGEGAQAFGHGLYFAGRRAVGEHYRDNLSMPGIIHHWSIGDAHIYKNGVPINYSPTARGDAAHAKAGFIEHMMIHENEVHNAWEKGGDAGARSAAEKLAAQFVKDIESEHKYGNYSDGFLEETRKLAADVGTKMRFEAEKSSGKLYKVELAPEEHELLDHDAKVGEQSPHVLERLKSMGIDTADHTMTVEGRKEVARALLDKLEAVKGTDKWVGKALAEIRGKVDSATTPREVVAPLRNMFSEFGIYRGAGIFGHLHQDAVDAFKTLTSSQVRTGEDIYKELSAKLGSDKKASEALYDAGIRGIRYEDAFSRGRGDPDAAHNYVMFHHDDVNIEAKYRQEGETPTPRTTPVDNGIPKDTPGTKNEATDLLEKSYNFHKPEASGERITFEALDRKALPKAIADALDAVEKFTGANVHIVRETTKGREGQMRFSGAQIGKHIFINENNEHPLVHVLSHEWTHYLKKTMPPLYQILENEIKRQATGPHGKLIDAYTASAVRRGYAPEKALEELTADTTGDAMGDRDFIERMARENPAAYGKLAESFGKYLDTFTTKHADLGSNKYVVEVGAYRQVLRAVMHTHAGVRDIQAKRDALTASMRAPVAATVDERKGTDEGPLRPGRTKDAVGLMYGDEPIPNNKMKKADAAKFLEERTREANGGKILDLTNDEDRMTMARTIADEAQAHIEAQGNALEWYDSTIDHTMAMLVVKHPEIAYDEDARTAFTIALAVTSQNMNVFDNLSFADVVYSHFKQHKEFPIIGTGEKLEAMKQNFRKVNRLRERLTWSEIREFFEREFTAGDLAKLKFKVAGELVDTKVYGSAILGPKIGNGFWSNLNGNFKPTTMDMWFMRTMGRLRGAILNGTVGPERLAKTITTFKEALSSPDDRLNLEKIGINKADLKDDDDVIAAAFALSAAHARDFSANRERYKTKSTPDGDILKSPEVRAADRIVSNIKGVNDAPANGTERNNLRDVVSKALAELKRRGVDLKPASLQALIWYPEQALYAKLGVKLKVHGEDYASATFKHLKDQGFDPAELERAAGFAPGTSRFGRSAALREAAIEADRRAGETVSEGAEEEPETDDVEEPDEHLPAEENVAPHSDETGDSEPVKTIRSPVGKLQIETPAGGTRTGTGEDGKPFSRTMKHDYGYIDGLAGRDGGSMDVLVGEGAGNPMRPVFVVHQKKADGSFDEHKVLVGFANRADAVRAYMSEYPKGWHGLGQVEQFSTAEFKRWAATEGREQAQVGKVDPAVPRFQVRPQQHDAVAMHATTSNPMPVRTGHEGTPLARLDLPNAPRASQARTHFDDASTVTKAHQVVLRNLYDVNTDPRNLFDKAVASAQAKGLPLDEPHVMNELENHIVAGGFDGYRSADGKAIVLGGKVKMEKANEGKPVAPSRPVEQPAPNVERAEAPAETPRPDVTRTAPGPREDLAGAGEGKGDEGTAQGTVEGEGQRVPDRASGKDEDQVVTDDDTSIRNAATDMVRKLRGAAPIERIGGRTANEVEADAHAALFKNPQIGSQIAASVAAKPRNISDTEAAILAIDRQRIANAHDEATKRIVKAMETGDEEEETLARGAQKLAEDARELNEKAAVRAGTEWSNSGRARMLAVKQDETLSSLLNKYKVAAGRDVNTEERAKIGKQADEIKKLKKQIESPGLKDKPEMVQAAAQKKFADALAELKKLPKDEQMTKECYI